MTIIREGGVFNEERNEALSEWIACYSNGVGHVRRKHQDGMAEERTMQNYVYDGYEVDFVVTDAWDGAFNAEVKIANTGNVEICDWALTFEFAHEIQNLWNATVVEHTGNTYVIKNADWNANIKPGEGVAFGMTVLCDGEIAFPESFSFVMEEESVTAQDYSAEFTLYSDWGTGCNGAIILSNLTDEPIENWQLEFDYDREIVDIANAVIVSHEQGHYVIKNAEYNADIAANSSVHISIVAGEGAAEERPENFTIQQTVVGGSTNGEEDGSEVEKITPIYAWGEYVCETKSIDIEWLTDVEEGMFEILSSDDNISYVKLDTVVAETSYRYVLNEEFVVRYFKIALVKDNGVRVESYPVVVMATDEGYAVSLFDTDGEGFSDDLEIVYGTDINNGDTDGDGLSDYQEVYIFGLVPTTRDTDGNGVLDGDEDFDEDGLSNLSEAVLQTDPYSADTDGDGLDDGEEESTYYTNPLVEDTDGDGVDDGKEIELGTNPLIADKMFAVDFRAEDIGDTVVASVQIQLSGEQVETLSIEAVNNETFFPETMPGYMGRAYDFSVEGEFDRAIISFEFDPSELGADAEPVIYYFNEEAQDLEELVTTINGNVASAEVTHFSKYILLDRKVRQSSFWWIDEWESDQSFTDIEIVFVIDDSGSMISSDSSYERLAVARTLIDKLPSESKIGLVRFDGGYPKTEALTPALTTDKEAVKNFLTRDYFYSPGGTDMYNGIQKAFPLYESADETTLKMMIVLSDGVTSDTYLHSTVISAAKENNIRIYTVGLGNSTSYFNSYMKPLASDTGATFYLASDATQLADIYKDISEKIEIETDSDGDGMPDYYEDNLTFFNCVQMPLDKNNPDTDGDGLLDGDEVIITKIYDEDKAKVRVYGKFILGNPTKKDTDEDGYLDNEDLNPFIPYKTPIILLHGLNDNTVCFGVNTLIEEDMNTDYGSALTKPDKDSGNQYLYIDCESHKILSIEDGRLGSYLSNGLSYLKNKNLFAFNYPNHDMVQFNALRLSGYIEDLIMMAQSDEAKDVVASEYLFATEEDKVKGNVEFILIGHSMGAWYPDITSKTSERHM